MDDFCILMHTSSWKVRCDMLAAAPPMPGAAVPKEVHSCSVNGGGRYVATESAGCAG